MRAGLRVTLCCVLLAGCGGSAGHSSSSTSPAHPRRVAVRVCAAARHAAMRAGAHAVGVLITSHDPADIRCRLSAGAVRVAVEAQASAQAWNEFDTTQVHQIQAYKVGSVHVPAEDPREVNAPGLLAMWIPAQRQIFATNGAPTRAGSYVTVTVSHGETPARSRSLARAVTIATLAVAPKGPPPT